MTNDPKTKSLIQHITDIITKSRATGASEIDLVRTLDEELVKADHEFAGLLQRTIDSHGIRRQRSINLVAQLASRIGMVPAPTNHTGPPLGMAEPVTQVAPPGVAKTPQTDFEALIAQTILAGRETPTEGQDDTWPKIVRRAANRNTGGIG